MLYSVTVSHLISQQHFTAMGSVALYWCSLLQERNVYFQEIRLNKTPVQSLVSKICTPAAHVTRQKQCKCSEASTAVTVTAPNAYRWAVYTTDQAKDSVVNL